MRQRRLVAIGAVILVSMSLIFVMRVPAADTADSQVEAIITVTFETGSTLGARAQMIVNRIDNIFDTSYTREMIENIAASQPEIMGAIKLRIHDLVRNQMNAAFEDAEVDTVNRIPSYENPYFIEEFRINLTAAFFKSTGLMNLSNVLNGALDMGAIITYHFNLQAEPGWNSTFVYVLPSSMSYYYANTDNVNPEGNRITWKVMNWEGSVPVIDATLMTRSKNPTTAPTESENISLVFELDTRTITTVSFQNTIMAHKINILAYQVLPSFITGLTVVPADGIRLFIDNDLLSWDDLYKKTIQPIAQQTTPILENSSLNQPLDLAFTWDAENTTNCSTPYNITHMDDTPPIKASFKDTDIALRICQMPSRAFFGLINAGATATITSGDVNFGSNLDGITQPYTMILHLPTNITLDEKNMYTWNRSAPIAGTFLSDLQPTPPYTEERIETHIEIELTKMDLNLLSLFTGKTELTASTKMKEDDQLYVIRLPNELTLSSKINITYLNADAFRLCTEENVFESENVNAFLSQKKEAFQQRLSEVFHGLPIKGMIDRKAFTNSLAWDGDISAMDGIVPVVVSNSANEVYNVGFNLSLFPGELTITPQRFLLQGAANQSVTYRIIFPRGITVNVSDTLGKSILIGKTTKDGLDYVELSFDADEAGQTTILTCTLNASPVYVLGIFLPCILVFILVIILIVVIWLVRKKRKRGGGKRAKKEDTEPTEYSGEEYYVPPPPPSTKKK
jgi:hypothetical protein